MKSEFEKAFNELEEMMSGPLTSIDMKEALLKALETLKIAYKYACDMEIEEEGLYKLVSKQGDLLTGVVNAIKGGPPELKTWSHHDAPQLAADLKQKLFDCQNGIVNKEAK